MLIPALEYVALPRAVYALFEGWLRPENDERG